MKLVRASLALFAIIIVALTPLVKAQKDDEWGVLPIADTYTDSYSNTPHGSEGVLEIKNFTNILEQHFISITWLKFSLGFLADLPNGSVITDATLQLYCLDGLHPQFTISAYSCLDNSWEESSLIYSNMPHYNATPLDTISLADQPKWYSWKVFDAVLQAVNNGSNVVTIVVQGDTVQKDILPIQFISRDNTIFIWAKPLLTIYYTIIPEFPSILLILPLFMIATLLTATIYRKRRIPFTHDKKQKKMKKHGKGHVKCLLSLC